MNPSQPHADIIWFDCTESTNKAAREAVSYLDNLSVIAAAEQTAGRGQGTHSWHSAPGENLTFSMIFKPAVLQVQDILCITHATTLGLRDYLLDEGISARIKWPNDIWVGEQKICGILIENSLDGKRLEYSIIGIGFNLNETSWPADLPNPVSLRQLSGKSYEPHKELERLAEKIRRRFSLTQTSDGRQKLQEEFGKYVFRLGEGL